MYGMKISYTSKIVPFDFKIIFYSIVIVLYIRNCSFTNDKLSFTRMNNNEHKVYLNPILIFFYFLLMCYHVKFYEKSSMHNTYKYGEIGSPCLRPQ